MLEPFLVGLAAASVEALRFGGMVEVGLFRCVAPAVDAKRSAKSYTSCFEMPRDSSRL